MLGLKLIHVSKRDTWNESLWCWFLKWSEFGFRKIPLEVVAKNFIAICFPCVSNWDMSRYLAIIKVLQKFVLISNNYIFLNHFILYSCFVSKLLSDILKGYVFVAWSMIIMMPNNSLDSIGAGASSRHDIDEVFLDYSDFNRGAELISFQNCIWMYEILQHEWICGSNITIKRFLSDCICLRRFIHYLPQ